MQNRRKRKSSPQTAICFQRSRHARAIPFISVAVFCINRHESASYQYVIKIIILKSKQHASHFEFSQAYKQLQYSSTLPSRGMCICNKAYCDTCRLESQSHKNVPVHLFCEDPTLTGSQSTLGLD